MRDLRAYHPGPLREGETVSLSRDEAHHLLKVRRARKGASIYLLNGEGQEAESRIVATDRNAATLEIIRITRDEPRPRSLELAVVVTKSSAFDDMIQRSVELGMTRFVPLVSEFGSFDLEDRKWKDRNERWRRICIESLKQCERLWLPEIVEPTRLETYLEAARRPVALVEREENRGTDFLTLIAKANDEQGFAFVIGPEGGWSPEERERLSEKCVCASLGPAILRTETACLAALATVLAHTQSESQ